jgi:hypothetical protein
MEKYGIEMRQRLEELNLGMQAHSPSSGDHCDVVGVFDSEPSEVITLPISLAQQEKKSA